MRSCVGGGVCGVAERVGARARGTAGSIAVSVVDGDRIEALMREAMVQTGAPSYSVGIVQNGELVYAKAIGLADVENSIPATVDTPYQIGSVTKVFTATLLCMLRDEGVLGLDDPVAKWWPKGRWLPRDPAAARVTLRQLATHTSGLPGNPINRRDVPDSPSVMLPYSVTELYDAMDKMTLASEPGRQWGYSNLGVGVLGHVLELAAGEKYETLLREKLLEPLGMRDSLINLSPEEERRLAKGYWPRDTEQKARARWVFGEVCAFGGLVSTVPDLAKFVAMSLGVEGSATGPIAARSEREMQVPERVIGRSWRTAMGIGWMLERDETLGESVIHGGEVDSYSSDLRLFPLHRTGVIVLSNRGADTAGVLGQRIAAQVIGPWVKERQETEAAVRGEDWSGAAARCVRILKRNPLDAQALGWAGMAALRLKKYSEAAADFELAAEMGSQRAENLYNAACARSMAGDMDRALTNLRAARRCGFWNV